MSSAQRTEGRDWSSGTAQGIHRILGLRSVTLGVPSGYSSQDANKRERVRGRLLGVAEREGKGRQSLGEVKTNASLWETMCITESERASEREREREREKERERERERKRERRASSTLACAHLTCSKRLIPDVTPSFTGACNLGFRWKIGNVMRVYLEDFGTCGKFRKLKKFTDVPGARFSKEAWFFSLLIDRVV